MGAVLPVIGLVRTVTGPSWSDWEGRGKGLGEGEWEGTE